MDELRKKTVIGSFWVLVERFGYLGIQFVSNLVLARLLMPDDFGTVGVLLVFTTLSNVLIDSGLSSALIQKKEISEDDKSTVFFTNLILAISVYVIIFFTAPLFARYFHNPDITNLLRVIEVIVVIDAFSAIQNTVLSRDMDFKTLTKYKIISIVVAVAVSIVLAFVGMGVWALVIQYLLFSLSRALLLWTRTNWRPSFVFSKCSFKVLFDYGSKLLLSRFIAELYNQFQSILIGRHYTAQDLGYYTQAKQLEQIPVESLSRVVDNVSFPAYSKLQDDRKQLKTMVRQNLLVLIFVNTPLMFYLSTVAKPLLVFLYSDKWIGSVPYFQFLCLGFGLLLVIHNCSLTVLRAVGRTDDVLKLEIIKKILGVTFLITGMNFFGIWGIMYGLALNSFIELFLNGFYLKREIGYGPFDQIKDLIPSLLLSSIASVATFVFLHFVSIESNFINLLITAVIFASLYLLGAKVAKLESLHLVQKVVLGFIKK